MSRRSCLVAMVVLTLVPLLAASVAAGSRYAAGGDTDARFHRYTLTSADDLALGCSRSAKSVAKSCKDETKASYWLEVARCQNLSDAEEREECLDDASESRQEERELCREQHDARQEICDALGDATYEPAIDPEEFVELIDNPLLPYIPGTTWIYEGETEDGLERIVVEVTGETREILGVTCTVVRDRVYLDGDLIEDTFDWYAQDIYGNVWYFGELSYELEDGVIVSLEGSWEAGVDGAQPGIVMLAAPSPGEIYRQEFLLAEAEDMGEVIRLDESVSVPYGDFEDCLRTRDFTPIEPDVLEFKFYAAGVGLLLEVDPDSGVRIELIEVITD